MNRSSVEDAAHEYRTHTTCAIEHVELIRILCLKLEFQQEPFELSSIICSRHFSEAFGQADH